MNLNFHIVYISYDGLSDPLGQSQIIPYILRLSRKQHFNFTIISFEKKDFYRKKQLKIQKALLREDINWRPVFYTKTPPILSTIFDLIKLKNSINKILKHRKVDIIHSRGYISSIVALNFKKNNNIPFIFDMRGWWADEKLESGNWDSFIFKYVYKYFKKKEIGFFKNADKIISLTNVGKKEIIVNNWSKEKKIGVIPTCVDFKIFPKYSFKTRENIRRKLNILEQAKVLVYSGSLGGNYDFSDFAIIFKYFLDQSLCNKILIISKSSKNYILQQIDKYSIEKNRIIHINSDFNNVYKYLQASDIGLILYKNTYSTIGRSPTKLGEYWASGLPIVSLNGIGDLESIIRKYPFGGQLLNEIKSENLKDILDEIIHNSDKKKLRIAAKEYFHIEDGVKFYSNIYKEIIN
tara:strand:+ start:436 stop:1656 length:1221 start_codon:yes stop_codon:yes gene_type:complete